jgi:hypothetical protein
MFVKRIKTDPVRIKYKGDIYIEEFASEIRKRREIADSKYDTWLKATEHFAKLYGTSTNNERENKREYSFQVVIHGVVNEYDRVYADCYSGEPLRRTLKHTTVMYEIFTKNNKYEGERKFEGTDAVKLSMEDLYEIIAKEFAEEGRQ